MTLSMKDAVDLDAVKDQIEAAQRARKMIKRWKEVQEASEQAITELLGDADAGTIGGRVVLTHKERSRKIWDGDRLETDLGAVADEYRKEITFRQFDYLGDE